MVFVVAALEVSEKIQTVGAFAGFAAILGLAVLSVLYFGQAREVKRLREWAGRAPERAAEMQDRVSTDASRRVVAQPVQQARAPAAQPVTPGAAAAAAKTAPAPMPRGAGAGAAAGAAGAGVAAGAAAAATTPPAVGAPTVAGREPAVPGEATESKPGEGTDQPTVLQPSVAGAPAVPAAAPAAAGAAAAGAAAGGAAGTSPAAAPPAGGSGAAATPPAAGAPVTPAAPASGAAAAGAAAAPSGTPPTATPPTPATSAGGRPAVPAARPEPAVPLRSARSSREASAAPQAASPSSSPAGATIAIVAAVGAIIVAVLLVVTGVIGGGDEPAQKARNVIVPTAPEPGTPTTGTGTTATTLDRADVSLVVLNGAGVLNLARDATTKLQDSGYRLAASGNRGDDTIAQTTVYYASGNQRAARDIVRLLKIGRVAPLDAGTEVVAQTYVKPTGAKADVVVTLGADAAQP